MIIYKSTDRIPVKVGEITFWVSPLTYGQKIQIAESTKLKGGVEVQDNYQVAFKTIKFSVKSVEGFKDSCGDDYSPTFDADGCLSDDSTSDIMNLDSAKYIVSACASLMNEIKGYELDGVTVDIKGIKSVKKSTV